MNRSLTTASLLLLAAGTTPAAELHVPTDHPTIEIAIASASPGDEIVIAAGKYDAGIQIENRSGLTIRGDGKVTVGAAVGLAAAVRMVASDDIRLDNLILGGLILGGAPQFGVDVTGCQDVQLVGLRSASATVAGIRVAASEDVVVLGCEIDGAPVGVHGQSTVVVCDSEFASTGTAIHIEGEGSVATGNRMKKVGYGVIALADHAVIRDNVIKSPTAAGIVLDQWSAAHVVTSNVVTKAGAYGILLNAHRSLIVGNKVKKGLLFDIQDNGVGNHVKANKGKVTS